VVHQDKVLDFPSGSKGITLMFEPVAVQVFKEIQMLFDLPILGAEGFSKENLTKTV
jgi:hypothetical protein